MQCNYEKMFLTVHDWLWITVLANFLYDIRSSMRSFSVYWRVETFDCSIAYTVAAHKNEHTLAENNITHTKNKKDLNVFTDWLTFLESLRNSVIWSVQTCNFFLSLFPVFFFLIKQPKTERRPDCIAEAGEPWQEHSRPQLELCFLFTSAACPLHWPDLWLCGGRVCYAPCGVCQSNRAPSPPSMTPLALLRMRQMELSSSH